MFSTLNQQGGNSKGKSNESDHPTMIIPLSQSGIPLNSSNQRNKLSGGRVKSRIVLEIPSHSSL